MNPFVVGIRFQKVGKIYHFDASKYMDIKAGDFAVVETTRGSQLGEVVQVLDNPQPPPEGTWKPIVRKATPRDLVMRQVWHQKEVEAMVNCRAKAAELKLAGVKIVAAEFSFDGSRLSFLYSAETGDKVDLRGLRKVMQRLYPHAQVEMHQIGPRDVAKILGGMGACGLENRCCSRFLTEFSPISIKMAKEQGISLTPSEITGMCGRLRCCLVYEYEQYVEARKQLPKRGKRVVTPMGEGKVVDVFPLKEAVVVFLEGKEVHQEFLKKDIQPWDELEALRQKSQAPCDRHENGGCDCGKATSQAPTGASGEVNGVQEDVEDAASTEYTLPALERPVENVQPPRQGPSQDKFKGHQKPSRSRPEEHGKGRRPEEGAPGSKPPRHKKGGGKPPQGRRPNRGPKPEQGPDRGSDQQGKKPNQ